MGLRFRRRVRLSDNVSVNVGSRRASVSLGKPGASVNVSSRGVRATFGIPGSGLSYSVGSRRRRSGSSLVEDLAFVVVFVVLLGAVLFVLRLLWTCICAVVEAAHEEARTRSMVETSATPPQSDVGASPAPDQRALVGTPPAAAPAPPPAQHGSRASLGRNHPANYARFFVVRPPAAASAPQTRTYEGWCFTCRKWYRPAPTPMCPVCRRELSG